MPDPNTLGYLDEIYKTLMRPTEPFVNDYAKRLDSLTTLVCFLYSEYRNGPQ